MFKLLGIGVADIDSMSIFHFKSLIFSLSFTQNLCSSSTTSSHKSLYSISSLSRRWVHIIKSIFQSFSFFNIFFVTLAFSNLVSTSTFNQKFLNLSSALS
ncbi:MAG: hypothetical protein U9Q66_02005 [Patescibacteria group bacterium]|nr:hypothetical protein [Patescibacteria group bacterium]